MAYGLKMIAHNIWWLSPMVANLYDDSGWEQHVY